MTTMMMTMQHCCQLPLFYSLLAVLACRCLVEMQHKFECCTVLPTIDISTLVSITCEILLVQYSTNTHTHTDTQHINISTECAGPCGDTVQEPLKCQTSTSAATLVSCQGAHQLQAGTSHLQALDHLGTRLPTFFTAATPQVHNTKLLRSSAAPHFVMPRTRTEIGKRTFRVSASTVWNALPSAMQLSDSAVGFKRWLKTSLFNCADFNFLS